MRASTAYFVGAGTIVAAIAIGLGGGLIAGNIMHPVTPKQGPDTAKYERRTEPPVVEAAASVPSERVQYLTGTQAFGAVVAAPAQAEPQTRTASTEAPAPAQAVNDTKTAKADAAAPATSTAAKPAEQQAVRETVSAPENANARASDADVRRAVQDRRRAERRQHWSERRRQEMREPRDRTDWDDVARNVREDSRGREFVATRRSGFPQIRLFGSDDDD